MIFLIVEDLLLTTNIEELRENSDDQQQPKMENTVLGAHCLNPYLFHINYD